MKRIVALFLLLAVWLHGATASSVTKTLSTFAVTFTNASATITSTGNGLQPTTPIALAAPPTPFVAGTVYYVVNPATNSFQLSATQGGSAITAGAGGSDTATSEFIWNFNAPYTVGQYCNGDWWVVEPSAGAGIVINSTQPSSTRTIQSTSTVTISQASPGVITWTASGAVVNRPVDLTTTGTLPSPLVAGGTYYVKTVIDANNFTVSTTLGGTAIATTTAGSGTHTASFGRVINGSMVNPAQGPETQGWDSSMYAAMSSQAAGLGPQYYAVYNIGRPTVGGVSADMSAGNPANIAAGSTVVSTISMSYDSSTGSVTRCQIYAPAILTVVASAPASGDFRPPIWTTDKSGGPWNESSLNYTILSNQASISGQTPSQATIEQSFAYAIFFQITGYNSQIQYSSPVVGNPSGLSGLYGQNLGQAVGTALLYLNTSHTNSEKRLTYIRLVQMGIDLYGACRAGATYPDLTGLMIGKKAVVVLAGLAFADANIAAYGNGSTHLIFSEDMQTYYVPLSKVGVLPTVTSDNPYRERIPYWQNDVGNPDWGEQPIHTPGLSCRNWITAEYRDICGSAYVGQALGIMLITGGVAAWNYPAFFDYADRYEPNQITAGANPTPAYHLAAWTAYRSLTSTPPQIHQWDTTMYRTAGTPGSSAVMSAGSGF